TQLNLPVGRRLLFKRQLLSRLRAVPGVDSLAEAGLIPLSGGHIDNVAWGEGSDRRHRIDANFKLVGPSYFKTPEKPTPAGPGFRRPRYSCVAEGRNRQPSLCQQGRARTKSNGAEFPRRGHTHSA